MIKKIAIMIIASAFIFNANCEEAKEKNLIKNGDFSVVRRGRPRNWKVAFKQDISKDKTEKPEGCANSLKVVIKKTYKYQGSIYCIVQDIKPDMDYFLSAQVKSTMKRCAFIQIKLLKDGKEIKRISTKPSSKEGWVTLEKEFSSRQANSILILCRFNQTKETVGQTVWFADVKLIEDK